MSMSQVVHHTDYRSKAEDRKKELEKLQEKGLTKKKAARLKDAPIPIEACNFLEKQRELFVARRKNQADAMEFLHQFRADDEFVLRTARRSFGSKHNDCSETYNSTSKYQLSASLVMERQPDARASVYSYAVYPVMTKSTDVNLQKYDTTSGESSSIHPLINPSNIIENSISFESAFAALKIAAKEASRQPLPEDDDDNDDSNDNNNDNHDNIEHLKPSIETLYPSVEHEDQFVAPDKDIGDTDACKDESKGDNHTTSHTFANEAAQAPLQVSDLKNDFSDNDKRDIKLEEIENRECALVMIVEGESDDGSIPSRQKDRNAITNLSTAAIIPYEAFSKLGESLVVESHGITLSKDRGVGEPLTIDDSDDESDIPGDFSMQLVASMMTYDLISSKVDDEEKTVLPKETQQLTSKTVTDLKASKISKGSNSMPVSVEAAERIKNEIMNENVSHSIKRIFDQMGSDEIEDESTSFVSRAYEQKKGLFEDREFALTEVNTPRNIVEESNIQNTTCQSDLCCDDTKKKDVSGRSIDSRAAVDVTMRIIKPHKKDLSVARRGKEDKEDEESSGGKGDGEEKFQESEIQPGVNRRITNASAIGETPRHPRRNRKKKKTKDESYYSSSSLFVARHLFSR